MISFLRVDMTSELGQLRCLDEYYMALVRLVDSYRCYNSSEAQHLYRGSTLSKIRVLY